MRLADTITEEYIKTNCTLVEYALCGKADGRLFELYCLLLPHNCISNRDFNRIFPTKFTYRPAIEEFFGLRRITRYWHTDKDIRFLFI